MYHTKKSCQTRIHAAAFSLQNSSAVVTGSIVEVSCQMYVTRASKCELVKVPCVYFFSHSHSFLQINQWKCEKRSDT